MTQANALCNKAEFSNEETTRAGRTYAPNVNIHESQDALWLWADMPGVDEKTVDVRLDDDVLTIEAQVSLDEYTNLEPLHTQYNVGNYLRKFRLAGQVDATKIKAKISKGVLTLELPKADHAKPRNIAIDAG